MAKQLHELLHNGYVKKYPDGSVEVLAAPAPIFRERGWEALEKKPRVGVPEPRGDADALSRAKRRARNAVKDLALSNPFKYFVTFTLDAQRVDRYDPVEVTRKLNGWLDNSVRRKGLLYVLVPELHKDGAIHFHGLINDALPVVDSGTLSFGGKPKKPRSKAQRAAWLAEGAHVVYNLPAWPLGFSTAIELYGDRREAVGYVCKYISKTQEKVGGRWYYSGGALRRPDVEICDLDLDELRAMDGASEFHSVSLGCSLVSVLMKGDTDAGIY